MITIYNLKLSLTHKDLAKTNVLISKIQLKILIIINIKYTFYFAIHFMKETIFLSNSWLLLITFL